MPYFVREKGNILLTLQIILIYHSQNERGIIKKDLSELRGLSKRAIERHINYLESQDLIEIRWERITEGLQRRIIHIYPKLDNILNENEKKSFMKFFTKISRFF